MLLLLLLSPSTKFFQLLQFKNSAFFMHLLPFAGSCDPKLLCLTGNKEHLLFQAATGIKQAREDLVTSSPRAVRGLGWLSAHKDAPGKEPVKESSAQKHPGMVLITES